MIVELREDVMLDAGKFKDLGDKLDFIRRELTSGNLDDIEHEEMMGLLFQLKNMYDKMSATLLVVADCIDMHGQIKH